MTVETGVAFFAGLLLGWVAARVTAAASGEGGTRQKRTFRPNKRQRKILATLPPDPERPTLEQLVIEEAAELGVDSIPGAAGVHLGIRLKVWKRDHAAEEPCEPPSQWRFVLAAGVEPASATESDVRLECRSSEDAATEASRQ